MEETRVIEGAGFRWRAAFAGIVVALGVQVALGLFGGALGIAAARGRATWLAVLWNLAVPFIATFVGAYLAVRASERIARREAFLQGLVVWSTALLGVAVLLPGTLAGGFIGTASGGGAGEALASLGDLSNPGAVARVAGGIAALGGLASLLALGGAVLGSGIAFWGRELAERRPSGRVIDRQQGPGIAPGAPEAGGPQPTFTNPGEAGHAEEPVRH